MWAEDDQTPREHDHGHDRYAMRDDVEPEGTEGRTSGSARFRPVMDHR